jgi:hypothetical protein
MDDEHMFPPALPIAGKGDPEQTIPASQPGALPLAFQDGDWLAEGEIFKNQSLMATRKEPNQSKQTQRICQHG